MTQATILVTGAGGFIGGHVARYFASRGHRVLAGYRKALPGKGDLRTLVPVRMDLADGVPIEEPVAIIVHAAAHTHLDPQARAADYARSNVIGTRNLAEFARRQGVQLVLHLSTLSVHGEITTPTVAANTPFNRPGLYGASKYLAELILADHADAFASVSLRLPGVVGRGYFLPWLGRILASALAHKPITAFNPQAVFNNVVDTEELARCLEHLIGASIRGNHTATLAGSEPVTIADVVGTVLRLSRSRSKLTWEPGSRNSFTVDISAIGKLGFQPAATLAIVERYVKANMAEALVTT